MKIKDIFAQINLDYVHKIIKRFDDLKILGEHKELPFITVVTSNKILEENIIKNPIWKLSDNLRYGNNLSKIGDKITLDKIISGL